MKSLFDFIAAFFHKPKTQKAANQEQKVNQHPNYIVNERYWKSNVWKN